MRAAAHALFFSRPAGRLKCSRHAQIAKRAPIRGPFCAFGEKSTYGAEGGWRVPAVLPVHGDAWDDLIQRAARLTGSDAGRLTGSDAGGAGRRLLGIAGPPGVGKSTVAAAVVRALGPSAVLVPMDGFHLAEAELVRLRRHERKGAIDTFDGYGFVALLRRLRAETTSVVYAPEFRREMEEPIAGAIPVP